MLNKRQREFLTMLEKTMDESDVPLEMLEGLLEYQRAASIAIAAYAANLYEMSRGIEDDLNGVSNDVGSD